jgi:hypothetical protein
MGATPYAACAISCPSRVPGAAAIHAVITPPPNGGFADVPVTSDLEQG